MSFIFSLHRLCVERIPGDLDLGLNLSQAKRHHWNLILGSFFAAAMWLEVWWNWWNLGAQHTARIPRGATTWCCESLHLGSESESLHAFGEDGAGNTLPVHHSGGHCAKPWPWILAGTCGCSLAGGISCHSSYHHGTKRGVLL